MTTKTNQRGKGRPRSSIARPPAFVTPMAAQVVKQLPEGPEWLYELKHDGYRALLIKDGDRIEVRSRKNKDLTGMYPAIALGAKGVEPTQVVIDGEIVALDVDGRPSFQTLQHRGANPGHVIVFYSTCCIWMAPT